jgi:uncharacterized repeat protein (TIGR02543 family)
MKRILLILVALLATTAAWAEDYITDVMVIGGTQSEMEILLPSFTAQGWTVIDQDLNAGCGSSSDYIYLLYKKASETDENATFISDFLISNASGTVSDSLTYNGRTFYLVPFDGSVYFKSVQGDLNSHCRSGSANIHLYYTRDYHTDGLNYNTVKSINFNATQEGGVHLANETAGYDLNTGCGSGSEYIYMHLNKSQGWTIYANTAGTECYINGFDGPKKVIKLLCIPTQIDGATVTGIDMSFGDFINLETMRFSIQSSIAQMPSLHGCSKFYNVQTGYSNYQTPPSITSIRGLAFAGTAVEQITFTSVTSVGISVFAGCNNLSSVTFKKSPVLIDNGAFSDISSNCQVSYPGSIEDWSPIMYEFSPNLVIKNGTSWFCGWCGGADNNSYDYLYWTLINANLKISSYGDLWENYPNEQVITTRNWIGKLINNITLERVYSIGEREFENLRALKNVYVDPTLHSIGAEAFSGCINLKDIWFNGNQQQWNAMTKDANWKGGTSNLVEHWHCTVTFDANGHGTAPDPQNIEWSNQDKATEPTAPTASGYEFKGWYTDAACTNQWDFNNVVTGDMTLYAGWQEIAVNIPGDVNGDGNVTAADVTALYNYLLNNDTTALVNGDQDGDGNITAGDVTSVYNILLGNSK